MSIKWASVGASQRPSRLSNPTSTLFRDGWYLPPPPTHTCFQEGVIDRNDWLERTTGTTDRNAWQEPLTRTMVWSCEFTAFTKIFAWAGCAPEWPNVLKMQFPFLYKSQLYTRQNFAKRWKSWFGTHWPDFVENHPKIFRHVGFLQKMWGKSRSEGVFGISELQTILDTPQSLCFEREAHLNSKSSAKKSHFWVPIQ